MRQPDHSTSRGQKEGLHTHTHSHTTSHSLNHKLTHSDNIEQGSQKFLCGCRLSCRFVSRIPFHSHPSSRFVSQSPFIVEQFARFTWMKRSPKAQTLAKGTLHNWLTYTYIPTHKLKTTRASWTIMFHLNKWLMYDATKQVTWIKGVLWTKCTLNNQAKQTPHEIVFVQPCCYLTLITDSGTYFFQLRTHVSTWMIDPCRFKWLQIIKKTIDYDYSTRTGSIATNL